MCESDVLGLHLDEMFGPAAPPLEWDHERAYKRDKIQLVAEAREGPGAGVNSQGGRGGKALQEAGCPPEATCARAC